MTDEQVKQFQALEKDLFKLMRDAVNNNQSLTNEEKLLKLMKIDKVQIASESASDIAESIKKDGIKGIDGAMGRFLKRTREHKRKYIPNFPSGGIHL